MILPEDSRLSQLIQGVLRQVPADQPVYLVGGAVRDLLLDRPVHDLDFVVTGMVRTLAQQVANALAGDFFMLDEGRSTARVIVHSKIGVDLWVYPGVSTPGVAEERTFLDFCSLRGPDLEADLRDRDFTIDAISFDLRWPEALIDPTSGLADLQAGVLRACTAQSFQNDPVRILRGVRLALGLGVRLLPETLEAMRQVAGRLPEVSAERRRDELFRMLEGRQAHTAVRMLEALGALQYLLPEVIALKGMTQSAPHIFDGWEHTLAVLAELERVWAVLIDDGGGAAGADPLMDAVVVRLGRYRPLLTEHFRAQLNLDRSTHGLLFLAALLHDIAKPQTRTVEPDGRVRFFGHDKQGARLAAACARRLALSQAEVDRLEQIVAHHMRVHLLASSGELPSRRAIFRYFHDCGLAGVDVVLLSLADMLATYGAALPQPVWEIELDTAGVLLEGWFERPAQVVKPSRLLTGSELMDELGLTPGPVVGRLLDAIQEAQAAGEIGSKAEALELARKCLR